MTSFTALFKVDSYTPDALVAGNPDLLLNAPAIISSGQSLKRGALLGQITTSGKYLLSVAAATDGSQTPVGILVDDTDASTADKASIIYTRGDFLADCLTYGAGHTAASVAPALRLHGIALINAMA